MVYIVTGASGDIGRAISLQLAKEGHRLVLCGFTNEKMLKETAEQCRALGVPVIDILGDLSKEEVSEKMVCEAVEHFGRIDGLVNTAGIAQIGLVTDMTTTEWTHMLDCNLTSVFCCCRAVTRVFVKQHFGTILSLSSVWGEHGASCEAAYSATKGAINSLTKALARELAPSNINVNALSLGMIDTKMNNLLSEDEKAAICEEIPAGRIATAKEAAEMVSLLLKAPVYMTGQIIGFDGGWM